MEEDRIREAILKVALGFTVEEVTEEYDAKDGSLRLIKRKETRKDVPPDLKAVKLLVDGETDYSVYTDGELEALKQKLIKQFQEEEHGTDGTEN